MIGRGVLAAAALVHKAEVVRLHSLSRAVAVMNR